MGTCREGIEGGAGGRGEVKALSPFVLNLYCLVFNPQYSR